MRTNFISFIIPTLNEDRFLPVAIGSIHKYVPHDLNYEVVVVDNGSTDDTVQIAEKLGAKLLFCADCTIAALRNLGAREAKGSVFVFLDADVRLTLTWMKNITSTIRLLKENPLVITGSRCGISEKGSWLERSWFQPLIQETANYINSGHLITTRTMFERIGGFDENLRTGEDPDFAVRAKKLGARVINNSNLYVVHDGYPKTLTDFIRREMWYGKGTYGSPGLILRSKPALLSILFLVLHGITLVGLLALRSPMVATSGIILIVLECAAASAVKYRHWPDSIISNTLIYYCYFLGRSMFLLQKAVGLDNPHSRHR